jgi:predicted TIM-barrel fold metal-dependent hydrolase
MKGDIMEEGQQGTAGGGLGDASRRSFLKGVAAVGASALLPSGQLSAQTPGGKARAIDCHHHFGSPAYAKGLATKVGHHLAGYGLASSRDVQHWETYSPAKTVEYLDQQDVATAMLSCTSPGVWFGDPDETRFLTRDMNDYGARMVADHKGRFGLFALLPLPLRDDSLREIEYAYDTLHADGIGVYTSYEEHYWLGDPFLRPVLDELNRRKAVVFVHPTNAFQDRVHGTTEFLQDTMRTIYSLMAPGTGVATGEAAADRYPDIRFIFSHAGGTMPSMIERFGVAVPGMHNEVMARTAEPNTNLARLRRFYYDTANSCNAVQLKGLQLISGASQILFGSDAPMIESPGRQLQGLAKCGFSASELSGIQRENAAARLFPRLMNGTI